WVTPPAKAQRTPASHVENDRPERPRPPARADERRAAAVDDVNRARCYSAAVGRDGGCDEIPPCENCVDLDAKASPRARCVPSPACGGGIGRGHATRSRGDTKRFICARLRPPHPSPASGRGRTPRSPLAPWHALHT